MESTPVYALPYPSEADKIAEFPSIAKTLATKVEAVILGEEKIMIGGEEYALSGTWTSPSLTFSANGAIYTAILPTSHIPSPPPGWKIAYTLLDTNSANTTWLAHNQVSPIVCAAANSQRTVTVRWELIKE